MEQSLVRLLEGFKERLRRKAYLGVLMHGWESQVRIEIKGSAVAVLLHFSDNRLKVCGVQTGERVGDIVISGTEQDICRMFSGDEHAFFHAKSKVKTQGAIRDQLKLEALIRLTSSERVIVIA